MERVHNATRADSSCGDVLYIAHYRFTEAAQITVRLSNGALTDYFLWVSAAALTMYS